MTQRVLHFWLWQVNRDAKHDRIDGQGLLKERELGCKFHEGRKLKWAVEYVRMPTQSGN